MGCGASLDLGVGGVSVKEAQRRNADIERRIRQDIMDSKRSVKLLLLGLDVSEDRGDGGEDGAGESGKSTVVKQMRIIHMEGFNRDDYVRYRGLVHGNVVSSMVTILKAMPRYRVAFHNPDREQDALVVLEAEAEIDERKGIPVKVIDACRDLWTDPGVQRTFSHGGEYNLWDCAKFFLTDLERIGDEAYLPTDLDILRVRVRTSGISEIKFKLKSLNFRLFDVGGQRSERKKWIHCFDDVFAIIFCVALSEYDQVLFEDESTNRMYESVRLFEAILNNNFFYSTPIILFLNKTDLFREKLPFSSIKAAFPSYDGTSDFEEASDYIRDEFKMVNRNVNREIYVHKTCATDTQNIQFVFDAVSDVIIAINLSKSGLTE